MIYFLTMSRLEGAYEQVADRLNAMDARLNSMDTRLNSMDARLDSMDAQISAMDRQIGELRQEMHHGFAWMMGGIATSWVTTMLAIFFHH